MLVNELDSIDILILNFLMETEASSEHYYKNNNINCFLLSRWVNELTAYLILSRNHNINVVTQIETRQWRLLRIVVLSSNLLDH